jgi:hypothetical protein
MIVDTVKKLVRITNSNLVWNRSNGEKIMSSAYARRQMMVRKSDDQMNDQSIINYFASEWLALGYDSKAFEKLQSGILERLKEREKYES